ncbi:MAG: serine protease [Thermoleophilia bacterium]|nr:serine protease [Thermoleophilia bacterium]
MLALLTPPDKASAGGTAKASIIGGHPASIAEFPALAFVIGEDATGAFSCTGTVVAPRVVLTAGHCVENLEAAALYPAGGFAVATGSANLNQVRRSAVSSVERAVVYPRFATSTLRSDAGLLILSAPVTATPLPLASAADAGLYAGGAPIEIAGWGQTNPRVPGGPAQLQAGASVVLGPEECQRRTKGYEADYAPDLQLCAVDVPGRKSGACHGDSGGPAIARRADGVAVQIGIVSIGGPNCNLSLPNIFTRVDQIAPWVASWIAATEAGGPTPALAVSRPHLPPLSFERAREMSAAALQDGFRSHFQRASQKRIRCARVAKAKVKCGVTWYQGGNDYYGTITSYYVLDHGSVGWDYRYAIHWVNDYCWFRSGHRQTCVIRTETQ